MTSYSSPPGGLPPQTDLLSGRAIFTEAYAVIPRGVMTDIVASAFPGWTGARGWVIARPLSGFAETFSQIIMELAPGGGAAAPETDPKAECVIFVTDGALTITLDGESRRREPGDYAYLPPDCGYALANEGAIPTRFHWIRKAYEPAPGLSAPDPLFLGEADIAPTPMPGAGGAWSTTRFVDPEDLRHDMHVTIVNLEPGGTIPFMETHVMEHGLYVLEGKGVYRLNGDWVEVEAGDFMWLRAFCPQGCYAGGPGNFRYLLYKDVNRLPRLGLGLR
ncbi:MAG: bifunctional allantoicase/(S)-ureidoglycine aminohydrolase [Pikeienuella sp.]